MASYDALLAEIRQEIEEHASKGPPIIFNDPLAHIYLLELREKFPSMKTFPGAFDLVVIGEKVPPSLPVPSQFRFVRLINSSNDVMVKLNEIDRKIPVMLLDPTWKDEIAEKGFEIYCPPRASPLEEYFKILSEYLLPDLSSLALSYLTVKEVLIREWKISDSLRVMAIHPKGMIYVIDMLDNVLVFNRWGKLLQTWKEVKARTIAVFPQGESEANPSRQRGESEANPSGQRGEVYVADVKDNISIFTPGGKFLRTFIKDIEWYGYPAYGIAFAQDKVYVIDGGIKVFDSNGKLIGERHLLDDGSSIEGDRITVSPDGKIYVSHYLRGYVWIFEHEGSSLKYLGKMNIEGARGVAIAPWGEFYISSTTQDDIFIMSPDLIQQATLKRDISRHVSDIAVSPWGEIYVANYEGPAQVFERRYD